MSADEIIAAMRELLDAHTGPDAEPMTDEVAERYEDLERQLKAVQRQDEIQKRQAAWEAPRIGGLVTSTRDDSDDHTRAFEHYLRTGQVNSDLTEYRAQSEGTGTAGGFLVPEGFRNKIVERMKAFGGLANAAEVITTDSGQPLPWVTNDDVANEGEIVAEGATFASGADLVFGTKALGAYKYAAGGSGNLPLKVSVELMQDSAFNVSEFVARKLGMRLARKQAEHWVTGTGVAQPVGLLSAAGGLSSGVTIADNTAGLEYDELVDAIHALDPEYRAGASWLFNDGELAKIRKQVDTQGRPLLYDSNMNLGDDPGGLRLLGYPVIIDQDAPAASASNEFGAFGNFSEAYVIRRVRDIALVTLNELYAANGQVGFFVWARADGMVQDANAAVTLTAAA